jgi:hypothetical protein
MADTGGIAALMKALNESPGLGSGLKPAASAPASRSNAFAAAAGISQTSATGATSSASRASASRPIRTAASFNGAKPKTLVADGLSYSANAPRGTYLDMVV